MAKRNLRFGMVNVGITTTPTMDDSARVKGRYGDPTDNGPVKQQYVNAEGAVVKPVKVYDYDGKAITLSTDEVAKLETDGTIDLVANVPAADVPSEWILSTAIALPQDKSHGDAYALVSHYLRHHDRVFLGKCVANGTTKVLAIRWSNAYNCLVEQVLAFAAQVRWEKAHDAARKVEALGTPEPQMQEMASAIFGAIPDTFDFASVTDAYGEALTAAIQAKAEGKTLAAAVTAAAPAPKADLMAMLAASLPTKAV